MHELVPQLLERLATRMVALGLDAAGGLRGPSPDLPTLDLSSEAELAGLFRSVTLTPTHGPPAGISSISSSGPARIAADVNHRLDRTRTRTRTRSLPRSLPRTLSRTLTRTRARSTAGSTSRWTSCSGSLYVPYLPHISPISPPYFPISPPYLPHISPTSPLYLPRISPTSALYQAAARPPRTPGGHRVRTRVALGPGFGLGSGLGSGRVREGPP